MPFDRRLAILLLLPMAVASVAEVALATLTRTPAGFIYPLGLAAGGCASWIVLALDLIARRDARPDRNDIREVRNLQHLNHAQLGTQAEQVARMQAQLILLGAEPELTSAARALRLIATRVEEWDGFEDDLPLWHDAAERWRAAVTRVDPGLGPASGPPSDTELRSARALLSPILNLSSSQLKAAITYIALRERIVAASKRLDAYREVLFAVADHGRVA